MVIPRVLALALAAFAASPPAGGAPSAAGPARPSSAADVVLPDVPRRAPKAARTPSAGAPTAPVLHVDAAPPPPGLGPHLARALRRSRAEAGPVAPTEQGGAVRALAKGLPPHALVAAGATVEASIGPIHALRLDAAAAHELARLGAILEAPAPLRPMLDASRMVVNADATDFADTPLRGRGALIGTYDSGIDLSHPDFRRPQDDRSRVVAAWDQDGQVACDEARIGAGGCPVQDAFGHGTHVASIAAGGGPRYRGIAPEAELVVVAASLFEGLAPALTFMGGVAASRRQPLVVNLSLGGHIGAHDGSSLDCQAVDAFPHLVVAAAGNEAGTPVHASADLTAAPGGVADVALSMGIAETATRARAIVDVWGAQTASITASLIAVAGGRIAWSSRPIGVGAAGRTEVIIVDGVRIGTVDLDAEATLSPLNGRPHLGLYVELHQRVDAVIGLRVRGRGVFHAWIDAPADEPIFPSFGRAPSLKLATEIVGDDRHSISDLATASRAIAVSSLVSRNTLDDADGSPIRLSGELGQLSGFSSHGPSLDPERTGPKPDLAAPGQLVIGAASRTEKPNALYRGLSGTSMAVPHVTGGAALLLGAIPGATPDQLRVWLVGSAAAAPDADPRWGTGILDVAAAAERAGLATQGCGCAAAEPRASLPLTALALFAALIATTRVRPRS